MHVRISKPEGTVIISNGTLNPHSGPCYYDLTKLYVFRRRKDIRGEIYIECHSFADGEDLLAENVIKEIVRHFVWINSRSGKLSFFIESRIGRSREIDFKFNFEPTVCWRTRSASKRFVALIKEGIYKRICGYDRK